MAALDKKVYSVQEIAGIIALYGKAIDACSIYVNDPKKNKRSVRYKLVNENMKALNAEMLKLEKVKDLIEDGSWAEKQATVAELIAEVGKLPAGEQISKAQLKRREEEERRKEEERLKEEQRKEEEKKKPAYPAEMKDVVAKKTKIDAMKKDTPKQAEAYAKEMQVFINEKEKALKKFVANTAKKDKKITSLMKDYYTALIELSILREKRLSGGGGEKTDRKIREKLEKIAKNRYHSAKHRVIPAYLRRELFDGKMPEVDKMFEEFGVKNSRITTTKKTQADPQTKLKEIKADPAELAAPDSFDKTVNANIEKGRIMAQELLKKDDGSVNEMRMTKAAAEAEKAMKNSQKYLAEHKAERDKILSKPENERNADELQKEQEAVERCQKEVEQKKALIDSINEAMGGADTVMLTAKDSYFMQDYGEATEEPVFKEGEDLMKGLKQIGDTCYFTCELLGLVNGKHDEFIKKILIREHPTDRKKAIVRLHDANGRPLDIAVEKSRQIFDLQKADTEYDKRALWVILVEKAAAVVMNKTGFKDQSPNPFNGGGILKNNTDWKALAEKERQGEDYCEKKGLSTVNINSGAETAGARMLFGKEIMVLDTRQGGEKDELGNAINQYNPNSDIVIGQMDEFLKQGKIVVGGTCGNDGIAQPGEKIAYNYESHGILFDKDAPVQDGHAICFKSVDMAAKTITLLDSQKDPSEEGGNETTITFGEFRRYFSNVYVIDAPKKLIDNGAK